jgi:hypothetical protein
LASSGIGFQTPASASEMDFSDCLVLTPSNQTPKRAMFRLSPAGSGRSHFFITTSAGGSKATPLNSHRPANPSTLATQQRLTSSGCPASWSIRGTPRATWHIPLGLVDPELSGNSPCSPAKGRCTRRAHYRLGVWRREPADCSSQSSGGRRYISFSRTRAGRSSNPRLAGGTTPRVNCELHGRLHFNHQA